MNQYDGVMLTRDLPHENINKWSVGTILEVYDESHFEVEFCDRDGFTLYLGLLAKESLELIYEDATKKYTGRFAEILNMKYETSRIIHN